MMIDCIGDDVLQEKCKDACAQCNGRKPTLIYGENLGVLRRRRNKEFRQLR